MNTSSLVIIYHPCNSTHLHQSVY